MPKSTKTAAPVTPAAGAAAPVLAPTAATALKRTRRTTPSKSIPATKAGRAAKALLRDVKGSGFVMTALTIAGLGVGTASLAVALSPQQRPVAIEQRAPASIERPLLVRPVYRIGELAPDGLPLDTRPGMRRCELENTWM